MAQHRKLEYNTHLFLAFDFPLAAEPEPLDATLAARDVWAVVDLLPFLTTSSCLF